MIQKNCNISLGGTYCVNGDIYEVSGDMNTYVYDKNMNGIVDNSELVNGFSVDRNVLADEYTNEQIENLIETKTEEVVSESITDIISVKIDEEIDKQNLINAIKINEVQLPSSEGTVIIPISTNEQLGVVKSSSEENKIFVSENGEMIINSINFNKIVQSEGDTIVLDGGTSSL